MTLRTRRRISPRTKRRYRAIRNFFRRTLGSVASQPDIKINSSIAVNVTDLKHKIAGVEYQQDGVCKHCHSIVSFNNISRKDESLVLTDGNDIDSSIIQKDFRSDKSFVEKDTRRKGYKTSNNYSIKAENRDSLNYFHNEPSNMNLHLSDTMNHDKYYDNHFVHKLKSKKSTRDFYDSKFEVCHRNLRKNRPQPDPDIPDLYDWNVSNPYPASHDAARSGRRRGRRQPCPEQHTRCPVQEEVHVKRHKDKVKRNKSEKNTKIQDDSRGRTTKSTVYPFTDELDLNFISDLIQRQYKPVKVFDTRSDSSQVSSPVCRDNEFSKPEVIAIGSEICSCCAVGGRAARRRGPVLADMRSLCDTRLYSSRRRAPSRPSAQYADAYNDSNLYDVVPVKEKSSPKSRRKFVEDHMHYEHIEVPPSPRSHRPRLNLQAQNHDGSGGSPRFRSKQSRRNRSPYQQRKPEYADSFRSEDSSDEAIRIKSTGIKTKPTKNAEIQEDMGTMSSVPVYQENTGFYKTNSTFNDTLNRTECNNDKTDKALSEIKDILQSFLQEIKQKASANSGEVIGKADGQCCEELHDSPKITLSVLQNSGHDDLADNGPGPTGPAAGPATGPATGPPPCLASPCCCRVVPVYPCVHNFLGSPTCSQCQSHTHGYNESDAIHGPCKQIEINETDNLIREIYKYVAQNTNMRKTESSEINRWKESDEINTKELTSKGVDKSIQSRHDAGVGTEPACPRPSYSKSCETLSARAPPGLREHAAACHSDTVLDTTAMQSTTNYETTTANEVPVLDKGKKCKFVSVLQSFGILKKDKKTRKDIIEEESETETTKMNEKAKQKYPFRQDLTNYMMHTQEFYRPPPCPSPRHDRLPSPPYDYDYPPYGYRMNDKYDPYRECMHAHASAPPHGIMRPEASAPPYPCPCTYDPLCSHNMHPQVPLCLKEVEVRSTGTQSEKGKPFFRKFSQRKPVRTGSAPQPSRDDNQNNYDTQTAPGKPGLFARKWKDLQSKAAGKKFDFEPFAYTYNDQQKLAQGDEKMRVVMLKKLFAKRSPFSPRNLIVRTLAGKDRSSWGIPPPGTAQHPRMFF